MLELFGLGAVAMAQCFGKSRAAGGGANGTVQPRGAHPVEEAQIHAGAVEQSHGAGIAVRQDGFRAVLGSDGAQAAGDGVESFIPGDALELAGTLGADSLLRIKQAVGGILALQVAGDFAAQEAAGNGMIWVSTQPGTFSVIYIDEQRAAVGAIEGADGVSHFRHIIDYNFLQS